MNDDARNITKQIVDTLARRMRALRMVHGLTIGDLARRTCVTHSCIKGVEDGGGSPNLYTVVAIAHGLDVRLADLFYEDTFLDLLVRVAEKNRWSMRSGTLKKQTPHAAHVVTKETIKTVARRVRSLRSARGLEIGDLAKRTNVGASTIRAFETHRTDALVYTLVSVVGGLGVRLADLLDEQRFLKSLGGAVDQKE